MMVSRLMLDGQIKLKVFVLESFLNTILAAEYDLLASLQDGIHFFFLDDT